jgi:hypothetical protein
MALLVAGGGRVPTEQNPYSPPQAELVPAPAAAVEAENLAGPRGIGGWLILPLLGLLFTLVRMLAEMREFAWVLKPGAWAALTTPGAEAYHPLWGPTIIFELITAVGFLGFTLVTLVLFLRKSRRVPRLMMIWWALTVAIQGIDMILIAQIPALKATGDARAATDLMRSVIGSVIWIPYFYNSRRVKNTFVQ